MASKLVKTNPTCLLQSRKLAQAAHKAIEGHHALPKQQLQQTKMPSGLVVAAHENYSPVTRIGIFVRAGSRFEQPGQLGVSHALRNAAGHSTKASTMFGITRNVEYNGSHLYAIGTREDIAYVLEGNRDTIGANIGYLADTVSRPAFKPWELEDESFRMSIDVQRLKKNPQAILIEALHRAAYRSGLSNSLLSPKYNIGKHDHNTLMSFFVDNFVASRMAVVGLGIDLKSLVHEIERSFEISSASSAQKTQASKFTGGDVRVGKNLPVTYAAVVTEGAASSNQKEVLALALFQQILGTGPRLPYTTSGGALGLAGAQASQDPVAISGLNISYSDSGLFGFAAAASPDDIGKVLKSVVAKMRDTAKSFKDAELQKAKHQLKASTLIALENQDQLLEEMGAQALSHGQVLSLSDMEKAIDSVSGQDVAATIGKVLKGKLALAAVGQLHNVPSADELI
ncbi:Cytochrome b-c1 complex subunit 2, mitochondrial [Halotydeus destructor]|nr:Cytochrome b-c1 complex subunit 2, mitochondrial [Halotydeus destructor]